jgi:hypothetical protein
MYFRAATSPVGKPVAAAVPWGLRARSTPVNEFYGGAAAAGALKTKSLIT